MTRQRGLGDFAKTLRPRSSDRTKAMAGIQTHLSFLVRYQWPDIRRPSAMAVRTEDEILDYVKQILEIRQRAEREHWDIYLRGESELLKLCEGRLPAAIRLRAGYCYRHSPRVKVAEMLYAGKFCRDYASTVVRRYKEETGHGQADFEEQLPPTELEQWKELQSYEAAEREKFASKDEP